MPTLRQEKTATMNWPTFIVILILLVVLAVAMPLAVVWALNTLFPVLAIPYNFFTWSAVFILGVFFRANVSVKKERN